MPWPSGPAGDGGPGNAGEARKLHRADISKSEMVPRLQIGLQSVAILEQAFEDSSEILLGKTAHTTKRSSMLVSCPGRVEGFS